MRGLRSRCKDFLQQQARDGMLRQNDPVEQLARFVLAETGKARTPELGSTMPLVLYFGDETSRDEFIVIFNEIHPNTRTIKV